MRIQNKVTTPIGKFDFIPIKLGLMMTFFIVNFHNQVCSQISESFSDTTIFEEKIWAGEDSVFKIDIVNSDSVLRLDANESGTRFIFRESEAIEKAVWEFSVGWLGFSSGGLSSQNEVFVLLNSNDSDITKDITSYVVRIGNTEDEISLYKLVNGSILDNSNLHEIIDGQDDITQNSAGYVRVRVEHDSGQWTLSIRTNDSTEFEEQGIVSDDQIRESNFFGLVVQFTSSYRSSFYFDDVFISGDPFMDIFPPEIDTIIVISENRVRVKFNEELDLVYSEQNLSVTLDPELEIVDVRFPSLTEMDLYFSRSIPPNEVIRLNLTGIRDIAGNISDNLLAEFKRVFIAVPNYRDVVINEVMADPPNDGTLPDAEYLELVVLKDHINLKNWKLDGVNDQGLPELFLDSGDYVLVASADNLELFENEITKISWGPGSSSVLTNSGETIKILDNAGNIIDSLSYKSSVDGISMEQVNPIHPCPGLHNFEVSHAEPGGTPGLENSVFSIEQSLAPPTLADITTHKSYAILEFDQAIDFIEAVRNNDQCID
jgi:hypothetical protein